MYLAAIQITFCAAADLVGTIYNVYIHIIGVYDTFSDYFLLYTANCTDDANCIEINLRQI